MVERLFFPKQQHGLLYLTFDDVPSTEYLVYWFEYYYTPEGLYYVMAQDVRLSVRPLANSCEHNSSYSFHWMILKPSMIVTHGT